MSDEDEGFAKRWSRRKQEARVEEKAATAIPDEMAEGGDVALPDGNDGSDTTAETPVPDLPDVEDLDADSDFTPFMQAGVPESIQRLALRKLWQSNPILANLDGLNDYDEDFKSLLEAGAEYIARAREAGEKFIGEIEDDPEPEISNADDAAPDADRLENDPDDDIGTDEV